MARNPDTSDPEFLSALFEDAPDAIFVYDLRGRFYDGNRAAERVAGYSREELIGKSFLDLDLLDADQIPAAARTLEDAAAGRSSPPTELRLRRKDGSEVWVEIATQPFQADLPLVIGIARDVTERRGREEARRRHRNRLEALIGERTTAAIKTRDLMEKASAAWRATFDALSFGILTVDREDRVTRMNLAARELTESRDYAELLGSPLKAIASREPWRTVGAVVREAWGSARTRFEEATDDETGRVWNITGRWIERQRDRVVVTIHDVTVLTALRQDLRRAEQQAEMATLLMGVAHDLRNPLHSLGLAVDALADEDVAPHPLQDPMQKLLTQMNGLVSDLLEYGRPAILKLPDQATLSEIAAEAVERCRPAAQDRGVQVRLIDGESPTIPAHRGRLTRVIENLVLNAIQFSRSGQTIEVETGLGEGGVAVEVRDQGPGIPDEDLSSIFEPFFTHRGGGTGLGLAIARKIMEEHGGEIGARNREEGAGAVFRVSVPRHPALGAAESNPDAASDDASVSLLQQQARNHANQGRPREARQLLEQALVRVRALENPRLEGEVLVSLADLESQQGHMDYALTTAESAVRLLESSGVAAEEARALRTLAGLHQQQGRYDEAQEILERARRRSQSVDDEQGETEALQAIAVIDTLCERLDVAEARLQEAMERADRQSWPSLAARILLSRAHIEHLRKRHQEAHDLAQEALPLVESIGDSRQRGIVLGNLGIIYAELDSHDQAVEACHHALRLHRRNGHPEAEASVLGTLARIAYERGDYESGDRYTQAAISICCQVGQPRYEAIIRENAAASLQKRGRHEEELLQRRALLELSSEPGPGRARRMAELFRSLTRAAQPVEEPELSEARRLLETLDDAIACKELQEALELADPRETPSTG